MNQPQPFQFLANLWPTLGRWLLATAAFAALSIGFSGVAGTVHAAGLGKMKVLSALGAPFNAEVELTNLKPEELANLTARVASSDIFRQAGLDFNPALVAVRATILKDANPVVIKLSSNSALSEPLIEMLLELNWQSGRLIRQYTVLLDPISAPAVEPPAPVVTAEIASPVPTVQPSASAFNTATTYPQQDSGSNPASANNPTPNSALEAVNNTASADGINTYYTQPVPWKNPNTGSTSAPSAWPNNQQASRPVRKPMAANTARRNVAARGWNTEPVIWNGASNASNTANNTNTSNSLLSGLVNPPAAQTNDAPSWTYSQYKQKVASNVKPLQDREKSAKSVSSAVTASAPKAVLPSAQDQLKVSGNAEIGNKANAAQNKAASEEARISQERAVADKKAQIAQLEKTNKQALAIKNNSLAAAAPAGVPAPAPAKSIDAEAKPSASTVATAPVAKPELKPEVKAKPDAKPDAKASTATSDETINNLNKSKAAAATAAAAAAASPAAQAVADANAAKPKLLPTPVPAPATNPTLSSPESNWYDSIDPLTIGGLLGVLGLGGAWYAYRRRKNKASEFANSEFGSKDTQSTLSAGEGGQAVDTFNSVFVSSFAEQNTPLESVEVDPIAEADVYMQYGRDAHAEDILKDALKQNPNRHPVRLKLMELYASKGNQPAIQAQFEAISELTKRSGKDWTAAKQLFDSSQRKGGVDVGGTMAALAPAKVSGLNPSTPGNTALNNNVPRINLGQPTMIGDVPPPPANAANRNNANFNGAMAIDLDDVASRNTRPMRASGNGSTNTSGLNGLSNDTKAVRSPASTSPSASKTNDLNGSLAFDLQTNPDFAKPSNPLGGKAIAAVAGAAIGAKAMGDSVLEFNPASLAPNKPQPSAAPNLISNTNMLDKLSGDSNASSMQAIETKFSLAQAYMDIGDKDGAKELLQEVLESGHQQYSSQAKAMLAKL
jgi:pilus assembly protein FimV